MAARADGLPFAVEELAFALRDGGHLAYSDGTLTLTGAVAAPVPDGIREAVLLRAARLTDEERVLASTLTARRAAPALIAAHLLAAKDSGPALRALVAAADQHWKPPRSAVQLCQAR